MSNRIKELRERLGWSQKRLADEINTTPQQIGHLESGRRALTLTWMLRLKGPLKVRVGGILEDDAPDPEITECAIEAMEATLKRLNAHLTPKERAAYLLKLYAIAKRENELTGVPSIGAGAAEDALKGLQH